MKNRLIICFAAILCLSAMACEDDAPDIRTIMVASERIYVNDAASGLPALTYLVKYDSHTDAWVTWYSPIQGFDYKPGFEYTIEIEATPVASPPMDGPSERYTLSRIVSQVQKTSSGLPANSVLE